MHLRHTFMNIVCQTIPIDWGRLRDLFCADISLAVFTLEDEQIVWHLSVWCEFMPYCRRLVRANRLGKIVFPDGQISDDLFVEVFVRPVCTPDQLFVWDDLSVQTICSSSSVKTALHNIIHMKKLLDSDWLRAVQFLSVTKVHKVWHQCKLHIVIMDYDCLKDNDRKFSQPIISRKMLTEVLRRNFEKSFLEWEKKSPGTSSTEPIFFMFILLISSHTVFLVQFGIKLHFRVFQKFQIELGPVWLPYILMFPPQTLFPSQTH